MTHTQFLRIKKLTGKGIIEKAARHNHREILAEVGATPDGHIDPARVSLNSVLRGHGTAAAIASHAKTLMNDAGVKALRKDAVSALEIIFGLPPASPVDRDTFFNESVQWAGEYFKAPVISAIVHNDEAAPHCHVLVLPLVGGRMVGSDLMGGRAKLQGMQADFHAQVAQRNGLTRQTAQKRPSAAIRKQAIVRAFDMLEANSGLSADVLMELLLPHAANPAPLLRVLGLAMPTAAVVKGEFVKMMTKPCKAEKPIGFGKTKPIGFADSSMPANLQTLSCVGFANSSTPFPPHAAPQSSASEQPAEFIGLTGEGDAYMPSAETDEEPVKSITRERDCDRSVDEWSADVGDWVAPRPAKTRNIEIAEASVRGALQDIGKASRLPQQAPVRRIMRS